MRLALLSILVAVPMLAVASNSEGGAGRSEMFVNGDVRYVFKCESSPTGRCHNVVFAPDGSVSHRFSVPVGERVSLVDLPSASTVCMFDGRLEDTRDCKHFPLPSR